MPRASLWSVMLCAALLACRASTPSGSAGRATSQASSGRAVRSNVLRSDYAGSAACAGCHSQIFAAWSRSPMHRMTRDLAHTEISAPFDGRSLRLGNDEVTLLTLPGEQGQGATQDARRFLELAQGGAKSLFRVTKVIGGRYREDFVAEEVALASPFGKALAEQRVMPVSFLRFDGTLRYKGYSVMVPERTGLDAGLVWQQACILCHNTAPQFVALYDELYGEKAPSYQGSASNELPADEAFRYVVDDAAGLRRALESEMHLLGARGGLPENPKHALEIAISNTRERWTERGLVELGVGCESCHGGARAHAEAPQHVKTSFGVASDFMHVETATGQPLTVAQEVNRGCAKCHTVLFSQYPFTWEGGERRSDPGGSTTNSGEARDFLLGGCSSAMTCATCHDPHGEDSRARLDELMTPAGNRLCTTCHEKLRDGGALRAHSHHAPDRPGGACLSCHMPKKNMGLAYDFTAYHRIGSPTDEARVEADRPLECSLCHADRSVDQIVSTMEKWWGKRYDRARLTQLYGRDLKQNPLRLTLIGGKPHEQALAADAAVRQKLSGTTDSIVVLLGSTYPLIRHFAHHALEQQIGAPIPLDMTEPGDTLVTNARRWLAERRRTEP